MWPDREGDAVYILTGRELTVATAVVQWPTVIVSAHWLPGSNGYSGTRTRTKMLLRGVLPAVAVELADALFRAGRPDLATAVEQIELVERCPCNDEKCATFFTQPNDSWDGREVERVIVDMPGLICIHTVDGLIARIELLSRPDVRVRLGQLFPGSRRQG